MNSALASVSVASARSVPAIARPRPANAAVPTSSAIANSGHETVGPGRQPKAIAAIAISTSTTTTSIARIVASFAAISPVRPSGEPPSRLRTPYERS